MTLDAACKPFTPALVVWCTTNMTIDKTNVSFVRQAKKRNPVACCVDAHPVLLCELFDNVS